MRHGDAHRVIARGDRAGGQPVPLRAEHDGKARHGAQALVVDAQRIVPQRHGRRLKAEGVQRLLPVAVLRQVRPRHLKDRAHAHAHGAAVERVAARRREQHGVHAERRRRAEYRADVRRVHHVFQHGHTRSVGAQDGDLRQCRAAHGAEHAAREMKTCQLREHVELGGIDRDVRGAARQDLARLAVHVAALHQKRHRHAPRVERAADHERALGDEEGICRVGAVDELVFRQAGVHVQLRRGKVRNIKNLCHSCISLFHRVSPIITDFARGRHRFFSAGVCPAAPVGILALR